MPFDFDLTQKHVQGACYESTCSYFYDFHDQAILFFFQLFFKIFIFAGFILVALLHPAFI